MGWSPQEGARRLGLAKNTPTAYKRGTPIRLTVALACAALAEGLQPWEQTAEDASVSVPEPIWSDMVLALDQTLARLEILGTADGTPMGVVTASVYRRAQEALVAAKPYVRRGLDP